MLMPDELVSSGARRVDGPSDKREGNALPMRGRRNQWSYRGVIGCLDQSVKVSVILGFKLTSIQRINSTAEGKLVSGNYASIDSEKTASQPPSKRISKEVNLLAGIVLSPEADTSQQKWPYERFTGIWMATSQGVVVVEHSSLQLKPLLEERYALDLAYLFDQTGAVFRNRWNLINIPNIGTLSEIFISIDFLLLVCPVWERGCVCPHGDLAWIVNELELTGQTLEFLSWPAVLNSDLEKSIVEAISQGLFHGYSREFLVGWVIWRSNIVRQENSVGNDMS